MYAKRRGTDAICTPTAPCSRCGVAHAPGAYALPFDDESRGEAKLSRHSVVSRAERPERAPRKARVRRMADDLPVHSFRTLLNDLATLTKNRVRVGDGPAFSSPGPPPCGRVPSSHWASP